MKLSPPFGARLSPRLSVGMDLTPALSYPTSSGLPLELQADICLPKVAE